MTEKPIQTNSSQEEVKGTSDLPVHRSPQAQKGWTSTEVASISPRTRFHNVHSASLHTDTIFKLHLVVARSSRKPPWGLRATSTSATSHPAEEQPLCWFPTNPQIHRLPLARSGSHVHVWANNYKRSLASPTGLGQSEPIAGARGRIHPIWTVCWE